MSLEECVERERHFALFWANVSRLVMDVMFLFLAIYYVECYFDFVQQYPYFLLVGKQFYIGEQHSGILELITGSGQLCSAYF
jgi:hypothetical protein